MSSRSIATNEQRRVLVAALLAERGAGDFLHHRVDAGAVGQLQLVAADDRHCQRYRLQRRRAARCRDRDRSQHCFALRGRLRRRRGFRCRFGRAGELRAEQQANGHAGMDVPMFVLVVLPFHEIPNMRKTVLHLRKTSLVRDAKTARLFCMVPIPSQCRPRQK
jgi:hypothetical protein